MFPFISWLLSFNPKKRPHNAGYCILNREVIITAKLFPTRLALLFPSLANHTLKALQYVLIRSRSHVTSWPTFHFQFTHSMNFYYKSNSCHNFSLSKLLAYSHLEEMNAGLERGQSERRHEYGKHNGMNRWWFGGSYFALLKWFSWEEEERAIEQPISSTAHFGGKGTTTSVQMCAWWSSLSTLYDDIQAS